MLKDITLGQFFPGNSLLHKTDPRIKLIILVVYIVMVLAAKTLVSIAAVTLITIVLIFMSGIQLKIILRALKPLLFILILTAVINIFFSKEARCCLSGALSRYTKKGLSTPR